MRCRIFRCYYNWDKSCFRKMRKVSTFISLLLKKMGKNENDMLHTSVQLELSYLGRNLISLLDLFPPAWTSTSTKRKRKIFMNASFSIFNKWSQMYKEKRFIIEIKQLKYNRNTMKCAKHVTGLIWRSNGSECFDCSILAI